MSDDGELRNIFADHCLFLDRKRYRDYADLFAENGRLIMSGTVVADGRDAILAWVSAHAIPAGRHATSNIRIEVNRAEARGQSTVLYITAENAIGYVGDYNARFVKTRGVWKIVEWRAGKEISPDS